jgi:hypothetical protein
MDTNSKTQMISGEGSPSANAEQKLKELGITLPAPPEPFGTYVEAVQTGNLLFLTGMLPTEGHEAKFIGRVGAELDVEAGRAAAHLAALNALAVRASASGISRQGDAGRPARRVGGHFGRCPRPAESSGRRFGVAARGLRKREESLPPGVRGRKPSARHSRRA